jgi:hypothetical protein
MTKENLERLLNEACELLIIFEDSDIANDEERARISAIFDEILADENDSEMNLYADLEAQDWNTFDENKI